MPLRFRFIWNKAIHRDPRAREIHGLGRFIHDESATGNRTTIWVDARKLSTLLTVTLVAGWLGGAGGVAWWLYRNPYNRIGFTDLASPWRWGRLRELRGETYIREGEAELKARRLRAGVALIQRGLARHPDDEAARLLVAQIFAQGGYFAGLRQIMLPQLELAAPSQEFLRVLLDAAASADDHTTMLAVCDRVLSRSGLEAARRGWLGERKAAALLALRRPEEALAALDAAGRDRSMDWRRLQIHALCAAGRPGEAVAAVEAWAHGVPDDFRFELLAMAQSEAENFAATTAAVRALHAVHPTEPDPWFEGIRTYARAGWRDAAWQELSDGLLRFDGKRRNFDRFERICAEVGEVDLLTLWLERAGELGHPVGPALLDLGVAELRKGNLRAAQLTYERLIASEQRRQDRVPAFLTRAERAKLGAGTAFGLAIDPAEADVALRPEVRDWLRTLLEAAALPDSDPAEAHGVALAATGMARPPYLQSIEVLAALGHWPAVAAIVRAGLVKFPGSTELMRWQATVEPKLAAFTAGKAQERPALAPGVRRAVAAEAADTPVKADYTAMTQVEYFAKLDELTRRRAWDDAESMIRALRARPATWATQVQGDLSWREVAYALEQGDLRWAAAQMTTRLRERPTETPLALAVAREWLARGDPDAARKLAETIVAAVPAYKAGRSFLNALPSAANPESSPDASARKPAAAAPQPAAPAP